MRRHVGSVLVGSFAAVASLLVMATEARADSLASCGNIEVSAEATCEAKFGVECEAECTPPKFELACEGKCDGECSASVSGSCTASCEAECMGSCEVDPGSFDCEAECRGTCEASCSGHCEAAEDKAACEGQCRASCGGECKASCSATPPSASCEAKCQASCKGNCEFQANAKCDIDCHGSCVAELEGGCKGECTTEDGGIFCDGQYVDKGNNAEECINALTSLVGEIDGYAKANAECSGGECHAEGEAGASCGSIGQKAPLDVTAIATVAAGLGLLVARRRRDG